MQKHPRQMGLRQFIPPIFILGLLASIILALFLVNLPLAMVIPLSYLIANIFVSIKCASQNNWKHFGWLPLVFAILHIGYGVGFLMGLAKFWNRWGDKIGKVPDYTSEVLGG
jgi:hypothetical protein